MKKVPDMKHTCDSLRFRGRNVEHVERITYPGVPNYHRKAHKKNIFHEPTNASEYYWDSYM